MFVQIICSYTSAELEAFLQHITIMMNRRTRMNAPKAEAQIMTASSHVITLSVQWVPSYRKNSSSVHLTKETETELIEYVVDIYDRIYNLEELYVYMQVVVANVVHACTVQTLDIWNQCKSVIFIFHVQVYIHFFFKLKKKTLMIAA